MSGSISQSSGGIGGVSPTSTNSNPMVQAMVQKYQQLPTEKLQEMSSMMGGNSAQGQIIQKLLQQRQMMPNNQQATGTAQQPQQQQNSAGIQLPQNAGPSSAMADGGALHRAFGGNMSMSQADPWWERSEARGMDSGAIGFLHGSTLGRADSLKTSAPAGSYVIPADVVSGLGEGNSLAGARVIDDAIRTGPWGTPLSRGHSGSSGVHMPHPEARQMAAKGGGITGDEAPVPVYLSHGEYVVPPDVVEHMGGGDRERGHKLLDHFVETQRKKQIEKLKKLPGPVKE